MDLPNVRLRTQVAIDPWPTAYGRTSVAIVNPHGQVIRTRGKIAGVTIGVTAILELALVL